jgi:putative chitinase
MAYSITTAQLLQFCAQAQNADQLVAAINSTMAKYCIDQSPRRVRYFMAQTAYESANYSSWSENLTYTTPQRLVAVWPSRFTMTASLATGSAALTGLNYAPDYINNPQALANLVYANRGGNGDVNSGDGYRYRGRGAFQLTFANNYNAYSQAVYGDDRIALSPDQVASFPDAIMSAGWFWDTNNLNAQADVDAFTNTTRIINGSTDSVPQRLPYLNKANATFTW